MNRWLRMLGMIIIITLAAATAVVGDSTDLNDRTIATTIGVDKKEGEFWLYVEYANLTASKGGTSGSSGSSNQYSLAMGHGKTFADARSDLDRQLDKPLYIGGVRTLLMTERFAEDDLVEYLYRLRADETYRKKIITITTQEDLPMLFKTMSGKNMSVGYSIENTIKTLDNSGDCSLRTTSRLLENLSETYTGILIPCVGLQGESMAFTGYTVVNGTKAVGIVPVAECKGLNMLKSNSAKTFYTIPFQGESFTIETTVKKMKLAADDENGHASFAFSLSFDASLEYGSRKTPYSLTKKENEELTELLKQQIVKDLLTAIYQAQAVYRTDYLQCDDAFRVKYPVLFEQMNWNDVFLQASFSVSVSADPLATPMIDYSESVVR